MRPNSVLSISAQNWKGIQDALLSQSYRGTPQTRFGMRNKPAENLDWDGTILLDPEHVLHARYGAGSPSLYFVRPDGYIGFCCQPARIEPLLQYLERLFVL